MNTNNTQTTELQSSQEIKELENQIQHMKVDGYDRITTYTGSRNMVKETPWKSMPKGQITKSKSIRRPSIHNKYT